MIYAALSSLHKLRPITLVITGGAKGVDEFAHHWAERNKIETQLHVANWTEYGRRAGPIRNQAMLNVGMPDAVIAFPGGRGTADMMRRAEKDGVQVILARC
jgi:predicted Rossmann-fold nucleotide-binding protein